MTHTKQTCAILYLSLSPSISVIAHDAGSSHPGTGSSYLLHLIGYSNIYIYIHVSMLAGADKAFFTNQSTYIKRPGKRERERE